MCLILMAWRVHAEYPIVIAANRDEFHRRPTAAAQWWPDRPRLLAGRDLEAGGTWLGITADGQVAALTNYRDPRQIKPHAPSRGGLVLQVLESQASIADRLSQLHAVGALYSGFNLLCTDGRELGVYESVAGSGRLLAPGIYGLSNHLLDTPWPKVQRAKSQLAQAIGNLPDETALLELMKSKLASREDAAFSGRVPQLSPVRESRQLRKPLAWFRRAGASFNFKTRTAAKSIRPDPTLAFKNEGFVKRKCGIS